MRCPNKFLWFNKYIFMSQYMITSTSFKILHSFTFQIQLTVCQLAAYHQSFSQCTWFCTPPSSQPNNHNHNIVLPAIVAVYVEFVATTRSTSASSLIVLLDELLSKYTFSKIWICLVPKFVLRLDLLSLRLIFTCKHFFESHTSFFFFAHELSEILRAHLLSMLKDPLIP
jgi:hypothetical protein